MEGLKIMAIGDMNNDRNNDIVSVNGDQDSFIVHYYDPDSMTYNRTEPVQVDPQTNSRINKIASIVIARDASEFQSLIVIYYKKEKGDKDESTYMKIFKQPTEGRFVQNIYSTLNDIQLQDNSQPFFLDIDGDMK